MSKLNKDYFGTDGIRGRANSHPMTADIALRLGMSAGRYFFRGDHRHRVLIGKDTRLSGYMFEPALTSGFVSVGMDVILVGPVPTPAVAMLTKSLRADLGVMLSASHNSYQDNGIKLFGPDGYKISDDAEKAIEKGISVGVPLADSSSLGRAKRLEDENGRYVEYLKATYRNQRTLDGLRIVVDCANGASYRAAPALLEELGAEVIPINIKPDGFNINKDCGSTAPEQMCTTVISHNADLGIALDGDADRLVVSDEKGNIIDGDQLIAMIARRWQELGKLRGNCVVATIMSNLGLERYLGNMGIALHRTRVGDRHVLEYMRNNDCNLGGEQSGHIMFSDYSTTGDGLLAALQILEIKIAANQPLSELRKTFELVPQVLENFPIKNDNVLTNQKLQRIIQDGEKQLGKKGRLVIRRSGTEPVVRVMAEGEDRDLITTVVDQIIFALKESERNTS